MVQRPTWNDWLTPSSFRVRISLAAAEKLRALADHEQQKIRAMVEEIAELAATIAPSSSQWWLPSVNRPLLHLQSGQVTVRYAIDEDSRTLSIEHVIVTGGSREPGADGEFGQTG